MNDSRELVQATVKGVAWIYLAFALGKGLVFLSTIILARLLVPTDFGLLALGLLAVGVLDGLRGLGVGAALIYRKEDPRRAAPVAFTISLAVGLALAIVVVAAAPLIARFFDEARLAGILRVLSIGLVLSALSSVPAALLRKELAFRRRMVPELGKTAAKGVVSVLLALAGFGVWSLVGGQLAGGIASTALYWRVCRWRPSLRFDHTIARELLGYGSQIVFVTLLGIVLKNVDYLIIGRRLEAAELGYYTLAFRIPDLFVISLCAIVSQALFPALAKVQDNPPALRRGFLAALGYTALITLPVGVGTAIVSADFVEVFYTSRWAAAIPVMQALAIYSTFQALSYNSGDVYKAIGRPAVLTYFGIARLMVTVPVLWIATGGGILRVAQSLAVIALVFGILQLAVVRSFLDLRARELFAALRPALVSTVAMLLAALGLERLLPGVPAVRLIALSLGGALVYGATLWITAPGVVLRAIDGVRSPKKTGRDDLTRPATHLDDVGA